MTDDERTDKVSHIKQASEVLRGKTPKECAAMTGATLTDDGRTLDAYVNHGRWVADCPYCNGGIACEVGEPGICYDCGHTYTIAFPADREAAERILVRRSVAHQNWYPVRESVDDLKAENVRNGVRV